MQVENVWKGMRPMTKKMLVGALKTSKRKQKFLYDAHADWEIGSLLSALDEQTKNSPSAKNKDNIEKMNDLAEACASVLEAKTESAEIFIQLAKRALSRNHYDKFDELGQVLFERFSAGEIAEIIRQAEAPQIRAISYETMVVMPVSSILPLLKDPVYFGIACNVLEQQAIEFENDEAREVLEHLDAGFSFEEEPD